MVKLDKKGFMMAEVIVVSTIILGTLVGLYSIFNRMYAIHTERSYYYNVDAVYALRTIYKSLVDNNQMVNLINDGLKEKESEDLLQNFYELIKVENGECSSSYIDSNLCSKLVSVYGVQTVLFVRYDSAIFTESGDNLIDDTNYNALMDDYLEYLKYSVDFFDSEYNYMFIAELSDGDYRYYGNYRIG